MTRAMRNDAIDRSLLKRQRDWVGLRVRLLRTVRTRGGTLFRRGSILIVSSYWKGLTARRLHPNKLGLWGDRYIVRLPTRDVEIVGRES